MAIDKMLVMLEAVQGQNDPGQQQQPWGGSVHCGGDGVLAWSRCRELWVLGCHASGGSLQQLQLFLRLGADGGTSCANSRRLGHGRRGLVAALATVTWLVASLLQVT